MKYLGYGEAELISAGGINTGREISLQPQLWQKVFVEFERQKADLDIFLDLALKEVSRIILTGAGSSAFIGQSLKGSFKRWLHTYAVDVPTTDIVTNPGDFFGPDDAVLLVSFARSGNSPESVAAVALADTLCKKCFHLIITCDGSGELANYRTGSPKQVFVLPQGSNDLGLAMTGSYSGMLLAGLLLTRIKNSHSLQQKVSLLATYGENFLEDCSPMIRKAAELDFERAVFLGSGPLLGTATESKLKLQELTDGRIICKNDSYLGFRHGPKAVINERTLVVFLMSGDPYVQQFETDLVRTMERENRAMATAGVFESPNQEFRFDFTWSPSRNGSSLEDDFLTVCNILPAQILGFYKSLHLNLKPDSPSASGTISRVVEGVNIYPYMSEPSL